MILGQSIKKTITLNSNVIKHFKDVDQKYKFMESWWSIYRCVCMVKFVLQIYLCNCFKHMFDSQKMSLNSFEEFIKYWLSLSWSYGSWIYNYLWDQYLSPLKLWVRILLMARYTRCKIMWWSLSLICGRSVVFSGYSAFLHQYNWNIAVSGIKHHNPNTQTSIFLLIL